PNGDGAESAPSGHAAARRGAVQHQRHRRAPLAHHGGEPVRARQPGVVAARDGGLLSPIGDRRPRARRHRPGRGWDLSLGEARVLLPATLDLQSINLFATMTFAFAGLELAPTLGDEIHDPARTLRRGIVVSGLMIVAMYVLGTAAMLVALPHETVSITNGMPQATAALVERLGAGWLAP